MEVVTPRQISYYWARDRSVCHMAKSTPGRNSELVPATRLSCEPPGRIRTAYCGRTAEQLSVSGLELVLDCRDLTVVSVTCGRGNATGTEDGPLHALARAAEIPLLDFEDVTRLSPIDLVISFSNPNIFPGRFIDSLPLGIVNIHPAPLPEYRGCHMIEHAIIEGATSFGATLHYCDETVDTGPLIEVSVFPIAAGETGRTLWDRVSQESLDLLRRWLPRLAEAGRAGQRVEATPQDVSRARYFADDSLPVELELSPTLAEEKLRRYVRAYDHPRRRLAFLPVGDGKLRLKLSGDELVVAEIEFCEQPESVGPY